MISAHLYNVPTLHNALKIQLLCNKIAATLCYKVVQGGNSFKSKVVTRLCTGSSNQVTTLSNNLVTKLPHPCHKLGISIWDIYTCISLGHQNNLRACMCTMRTCKKILKT